MNNGYLNWIANFIWGITDDVLRDVYVRRKCRDIILPMVVIRRLDAVLEPTKQDVLDMTVRTRDFIVDSLHGPVAATIDDEPVVVEYNSDTDLLETYQLPLTEDDIIKAFIDREMLPQAQNAWRVEPSVNIGSEFSFVRCFYKPQSTSIVGEFRSDNLALAQQTEGFLCEIIGEGSE